MYGLCAVGAAAHANSVGVVGDVADADGPGGLLDLGFVEEKAVVARLASSPRRTGVLEGVEGKRAEGGRIRMRRNHTAGCFALAPCSRNLDCWG